MFYRWHDYYRRRDDGAIYVYCCIENVGTGMIMVDRVEIFRGSIETQDLALSRTEQIEMLSETPPEKRLEQFESAQEAIDAHDAEFGND